MPDAINQAMVAQGNYTTCKKYRFTSEGSSGISFVFFQKMSDFQMTTATAIVPNRTKMTTLLTIIIDDDDDDDKRLALVRIKILP